jgi:HK97 family phage portal protein
MAVKPTFLNRLATAWHAMTWQPQAGQVTQTSQAGWSSWNGYGYGSPLSLSKIHVDDNTALNLSAVWACVKILGDSVGVLPFSVLQKQDGKRILRNDHPVFPLLHDRPNAYQTPIDFKSYLMKCVLLTGNAFVLISRERGAVVALRPIPPHQVQVDTSGGELKYTITLKSGGQETYSPEEMLHIKGLGDGVMGNSVIAHARESISVGLASDQYGSSFFGNNARVSGLVTSKTPMAQDTREALKKDWQEQHSGSANVGKTAFLGFDLEYRPISIAPDEAQFLQTRQYTVSDVCRWFTVPPHMAGDMTHATFSNIEHQGIEFVTYSILPWVTRIEQEINYKLFTEGERALGYFSRMNMTALLRGDSKSRGEYYRIMRDLGAYSPNTILELEDMDPLPEYGDLLLVPMNMMTLENAAKNGGTQKQKPNPKPLREKGNATNV